MARAKDETTIKLATPSKPENRIVSVEQTCEPCLTMLCNTCIWIDSQSEVKQALSKRGVLQNHRLHVWCRIHIKYAIAIQKQLEIFSTTIT